MKYFILFILFFLFVGCGLVADKQVLVNTTINAGIITEVDYHYSGGWHRISKTEIRTDAGYVFFISGVKSVRIGDSLRVNERRVVFNGHTSVYHNIIYN